ncbi:cation-transporting ATPase [Microbacterium sp. ET2]|uniref:cation-transporting ATPase n=1 Tax=Microbacterium albipurpureum TaxID=3050384 RepID=UPI00259D1AAB|nr:cation-transporting ATPase [Microbacterium sp. ET2 (Ac-2212)]WJL96255.1 cation-transporting ATPase [Microbacterium sp. ET2 (Ac-2212)]
MSKLSKLIGMAAKALDNQGGSARGSSSSEWRGIVRSAADALGGDGRPAAGAGSATPSSSSVPWGRPSTTPPPAGGMSSGRPSETDRAAIARYDYLMRTADPHQVEEVHREAFARLTPQQRQQIESRMRTEFPPAERPRSAAPEDLALAAGRAEALRPGRMRGLLGRVGGGAAMVGAGGLAIGVLGAVAGAAVVSSVAVPLLEQAASFGVDFDALADGVDLSGLADGVDVSGFGEGAEGLVGGAGDVVSGFGDQVSNIGDQFGALGDFFWR